MISNNLSTTSNISQIENPVALSASAVSGFSPNLSICQRISNAYRNAIHQFVNFLQKHKFYVTAMVLGTLLLEPFQAIKAGCISPASWKKHFNFYNMNPKTLSNEQLTKQPILLVHGNYHNQSAWISLAKKLRLSNLGPVYTVSLPNGSITLKDYEIIQSKIDEIKAQYKQYNVNNIEHDIKINIIGHSRGGYLAHRMAWTTLRADGKQYWGSSNDIGKVIKIGSVLDQEEISHIQNQDPDFRDRVYEITGQYDILETDKSLCEDSHMDTVNSGHLGLLYSSQTHQRIIQWLS